MTVSDMLARMSSTEITEWQAFVALQNEDTKSGSVEEKIKAAWNPKS